MRVVSLCPSLTELVFDLGAGGDLVGRTRYCVEPAGEVEAAPALGGTKNPKLQKILELEPDLVLLNEEENRREDALALTEAGIPCCSTFPRNVREAAEAVRRVAVALGRPGAGEELAREIEELSRRARAEAAAAPPVRWAYLIWRKPWMSVNGRTYVSGLLELAGGENVFRDRPDRYPAVTAAEIRAAGPERVFLSSEPFPFAEKHAAELSQATGLPRERLRLVDGQTLSWHGSRTRLGIPLALALLAEARDSSSFATPLAFSHGSS